jgi:hypothetical protein
MRYNEFNRERINMNHEEEKISLVGRMTSITRYCWLLGLFSIPLIIFFFLKSIQPTEIIPEDVTLASRPWGMSPIGYVSHEWFAIFSSVALFGGLGATLSFFSRAESIDSALIRPKTVGGTQVFGAIFATILFLTFLGKLVQGSLFPNLEQASRWSALSFDMAEWAKLMVWSFIAGFSERFVPDILMGLITSVKKGGHPDTPPESAD